jgi:2-hydroxychromene-2-carboxylate isomerase
MAQKSPSKILLLHSIENNRTIIPKTKTSTSEISRTAQNIGINTDQLRFNRDISTNTPNYAEQMAKALENGNAAEEIVQMLMQSIGLD